MPLSAGRTLFWLSLALLAGSLHAPAPADPPAKRQDLTREGFRRNCLMCHSRAAPEGVSAEILEGLYPERGLKPFDAMPNLTCWRNYVAYYRPDKPRPRGGER